MEEDVRDQSVNWILINLNILSYSSQKPKMCFNEIRKENVSLTVGAWMRYACLATKRLLSALAAVVAVFLYHNWLRTWAFEKSFGYFSRPSMVVAWPG